MGDVESFVAAPQGFVAVAHLTHSPSLFFLNNISRLHSRSFSLTTSHALKTVISLNHISRLHSRYLTLKHIPRLHSHSFSLTTSHAFIAVLFP
jgi:hypothetical protein